MGGSWTSGIGFETARELARQGAEVTAAAAHPGWTVSEERTGLTYEALA